MNPTNSLSSNNIPIARLATQEEADKSKLPTYLTSMLYGTIFGLAYSFTAGVSPFKTCSTICLNLYTYQKLEPMANSFFPDEKHKAMAAKIVLFVANQFVFKAIYQSIGMFIAPATHAIYLTATAGITFYNVMEGYLEYKKRYIPLLSQNPPLQEV